MLSAPPSQLLTLQDANGAALADYLFYPDDDLLYVRWHGHLTGAEIVRGVQLGGQWRDQFTYSFILNDKLDSGGDWSDALPWLQYEWLPQAIRAGVKAMAYVFLPDRENQFATQSFITALRPHMAVELFENVDLALAWLQQQKHPVGSTPAVPPTEQ